MIKADGTCQPLDEAKLRDRNDNYGQQIQYVNRELITLIDSILAGPRPAIIVLHADEGPYPAKYAFDEPEYQPAAAEGPYWFESDTEIRREKTSIIMAIRHSDGTSTTAPRTPINVYPQILNHSFNAAIPLHPDRTFMFPEIPDYSKLEEFTDELLTPSLRPLDAPS